MKIVLGLFQADQYIELLLGGKLGFSLFSMKYRVFDTDEVIINGMVDATEIHFTLDGYDVFNMADYEHSYTRHELWMALHYPALREKTIFYDWPDGLEEHEAIDLVRPDKETRSRLDFLLHKILGDRE